MNRITSTKNKTMAALSIIAIVIGGIFILTEMAMFENRLSTMLSNQNNTLTESYTAEIEKLRRFYLTRIKCNVSSAEIIKAIENGDREQLLALVKPRYEALQHENPYLRNMHFHTKDYKTLLRLHNPSVYGDDLSSFRPIVVDANNNQKPYTGIEVGKHGIFFRVISPIYSRTGDHIGSLEFGVTLDYFNNLYKTFYGDRMFAFEIEQDACAVYKNKDKLIKSGDYYLITDKQDFFQTILHEISPESDYSRVEYNGRDYMVSSSIRLYNYEEHIIGRMLVAIDISGILKKHQHELLVTIGFGALLLVLILIVMEKGFRIYINNITKIQNDLMKSHAELTKHKNLLDRYIIFAETDTEGIITHASKAFCQISQYTNSELVGANHNIVRHPDMTEEFYEKLWSTIQAGKTWAGEIKNKKKDGSHYWVYAVITPKRDDDGTIIGYSAVRQEITAQKRLEEISVIDELTGLYNRRHFNDVFTTELNKAKREMKPLGLIMYDVDNFKKYNDTYGHQAGDEALQEVSSAVCKTLKRAGDIPFRVGGEEFAILVTADIENSTANLAQKLRESVEALQIEHKNNEEFGVLTISVGVYMCTPDRDTKKETIFKRCDEALYQAKRNGRNTIHILSCSFSPKQ